MEVIQRQSLTVLGQQGSNFGQFKDSLHKFVKLTLSHIFDGWRNVLHDSTLNNEPVRALLALAVLEILNLLLDALVAVFGLV